MLVEKLRKLPDEIRKMPMYFSFAAGTRENPGTEAAVGTDGEKLLFWCKGRHEKRYELKKGIYGEPFEGFVELPVSSFASIYLVVTGFSGIFPASGKGDNKLTVTYNLEKDRIVFSFANFPAKMKTKFLVPPTRVPFIASTFERFKFIMPKLTYASQEVVFDYYPGEKRLVIATANGEVVVKDDFLQQLKSFLEHIVIAGRRPGRELWIEDFVVYPDGRMAMQGHKLSLTKMKTRLGGTITEVPELAAKLWRIIS